MLGVGGGGDAVGASAVAWQLERQGIEPVLGGVAWERFPVDPFAGPRPIEDIRGGERLGAHALLVRPDEGATTPLGAHFCESKLAEFLGEATVLIDVSAGARGAARGIADAAAQLACDLLVLVDIGGDAIAAGGEQGLASPLCDAVMIAAAAELREHRRILGVLGAGCDGELRPAEVAERVAALAREGAWVGSLGTSPGAAARIEAVAGYAITEASTMVARCARGEIGRTEIRGGRRTVELGPLGAVCFLFDLPAALAALPLARAVAGSETIAQASERLNAIGLRTELDYERNRATAAGA